MPGYSLGSVFQSREGPLAVSIQLLQARFLGSPEEWNMDATTPGPALWGSSPWGWSPSLHPRLLLWAQSRVAVFPHPASAWDGALGPEPALQAQLTPTQTQAPTGALALPAVPQLSIVRGLCPPGCLPAQHSSRYPGSDQRGRGHVQGLRKPEAVSILV